MNQDKLYVGIDVSSKNNVCYLMYSDGSKHSSFSVPNNRNGAKIIVDRVTSVLLLQDIPQVVIGMEATSVYGDNLMRFLRESGSLGRFERSLHMLNPKQVKKFRDAYSDLPKNDHVDSYVIADHLRFGRINKEVYMDDYKYQALKMYTRAHHQLVQELTREKQRFLNTVFISFSGLTQENSYRPPQVIADAAKQMLAISMNTIRLLQKQIKEYDKAIEKMLEAFPQTLTSVKGIGNIYAAGIIAEIGDINRFPSQASLAKYAGLVWTQHQSSDFEAEDKRMIQGGNHHLKYYLCEAANALRRCDPEFKHFYALKYKEANKHNHKRALALTARKLVRLVLYTAED